MHFTSTLVLTIAASVTNGYILPNLGDGAFMVTTDINGTALFDPIRLPAPSAESLVASRAPHGDEHLVDRAAQDGTFCTGVRLNPNEEHSAWLGLIDQCNHGITTGGGSVGLMWFASGNAVWYKCTWSNSQGCDQGELTNIGNILAGPCGGAEPQTGNVALDSERKLIGRASVGQNICFDFCAGLPHC